MSTSTKELTFNIVESSTYNDFEDIYQRFKKIWLENPDISKKQAFKQMGENQTHSRMKYVNERMEEDGLQEHYYGGRQGRKRKTVKTLLKNQSMNPNINNIKTYLKILTCS